MTTRPDILCIGSVLWDIIGRTATPMKTGYDVPGAISRIPGGVALNIAMTLARFGLKPGVLTAIGRDREGDELIAACEGLGVLTDFAHRPADLPTDAYMAIESEGRLVAALADAASLEAAGDAILTPLRDGTLGALAAPWSGPVALDGNLTEALLAHIAADPALAGADLRVAPASPGKARRLRALFGDRSATFYVNRSEAELLCGRSFFGAAEAATALVEAGVGRAIVTDGAALTADAISATDVLVARPPEVAVTRITGAGDTFMAAHIAAEIAGADRAGALDRAQARTAEYIAGG